MTSDHIPSKRHAEQNRKNPEPDPRWIKERFLYCPKTGKVFNRRTGKNQNSKVSGYLVANIYPSKKHSDGTITKQRIQLRCHRIAFAIMKDRWPNLIGHKDDDKTNNIWDNLEETTNAKNMQQAYKNHIFKISEYLNYNRKNWQVRTTRKRSKSFTKYCEAWQFLQEMNAWREAGREGPAPTPKRKKNK
jgi:hypothetical protein